MKQYTVIVDDKVFTCCEALLKSDFDNEPSVDVYCRDAKMITDDVFVGTIYDAVIPSDFTSSEDIDIFVSRVEDLIKYKLYIEYNF